MDDLDRQITELERQLAVLKQQRAARQANSQTSSSPLLIPNPQLLTPKRKPKRVFTKPSRLPASSKRSRWSYERR